MRGQTTEGRTQVELAQPELSDSLRRAALDSKTIAADANQNHPPPTTTNHGRVGRGGRGWVGGWGGAGWGVGGAGGAGAVVAGVGGACCAAAVYEHSIATDCAVGSG